METFRGSVFVIFQFFSRKKGSWNPSGFLGGFCLAFGVPGRGLTCNPYAPVQSKRTFLFSSFFRKQLPKETNLGSILGTIFIENHNFVRKKGCEKQVGKNASPSGSRPSIITSRGSLTAPLACALFQKETIVSRRNNSLRTNCRNC